MNIETVEVGKKIETTTVQAYLSLSLSLSLDTGILYRESPWKEGPSFTIVNRTKAKRRGERERERGRGLRCWILSTISDRVVSVSLHVRATTLTDAFFSAAPLTSSTAYTRCSASTCYDPNYDFVYLCYLIFPFPLQFFISWIFELLYEFRSIKWIKILK